MGSLTMFRRVFFFLFLALLNTKGFQASNKTHPCTPQSGFAWLPRPGYPHEISSPNYPSSYSTDASSLECEWKIAPQFGSKVKLKVIEANLNSDCIKNRLKVLIEKPMGQSKLNKPGLQSTCGVNTLPGPLESVETKDEVTVRFSSHYNLESDKFKLLFYSTPPPCVAEVADSHNRCKDGPCCEGKDCCIITLGAKPIEINSPNYPEESGPNRHCEYKLEGPVGSRINLNFVDMDIHDKNRKIGGFCLFDFVKVVDEFADQTSVICKGGRKFCSTHVPNYPGPSVLISRKNSLTLIYKTDATVKERGKGFKALVSAVNPWCPPPMTYTQIYGDTIHKAKVVPPKNKAHPEITQKHIEEEECSCNPFGENRNGVTLTISVKEDKSGKLITRANVKVNTLIVETAPVSMKHVNLTTNDEGKAFTSLGSNGHYKVDVEAKEYVFQSTEIKVDCDECSCDKKCAPTVDIVLQKKEEPFIENSQLKLVIRESYTGYKVSGAAVGIQANSSSKIAKFYFTTLTTNSFGVINTKLVFNGRYLIKIQKHNYDTYLIEKYINCNIKNPSTCNIIMEPFLTKKIIKYKKKELTIRVKDDKGIDLEGATVTVNFMSISPSTIIGKDLITSASGSVSVQIPDEGLFKVNVAKLGSMPYETTKEIKCDPDKCDECLGQLDVFLLKKPKKGLLVGEAANKEQETVLTVIVTDDNQNKIEGANVLVTNDNLQFSEGTITNTNGQANIEIVQSGNYNVSITIDGYTTNKINIKIKCDQRIACKKEVMVQTITNITTIKPKILKKKIKIIMNWDGKYNNLDINVFQVEKQLTLENSCLTDSEYSNCSMKITKTNDKGGINGGEEVTFDDSFKSDDYIYMIYVKDVSKNPEEFVKSNIRITVTDSISSSQIAESTDNFDDENFWFAGCLKAKTGSFKFKAVNVFLKSPPHEADPFFCNNLFGLNIKPQVGMVNKNVIKLLPWATANKKQETILTVTVTDVYQNKIGGANVLVTNNDVQFLEGAKTNTNGQANIEINQNGHFSVSAMIDGYTTSKKSIQTECNENKACKKEVMVEVLKQSSVVNSTIITLLSNKTRNNQPTLSLLKVNIEHPKMDNCRTEDGKCKGIIVDESKQMVTIRNVKQQGYIIMIIVGCATEKCKDLNTTDAEIRVTSGIKSETIPMPKMDSHAEADSKYWIAGYLKIVQNTFTLIPSDTFLKNDPSKTVKKKPFYSKMFIKKKQIQKEKKFWDDAKLDIKIVNSNKGEFIKDAVATVYHFVGDNAELIEDNTPFEGNKVSSHIKDNGLYLSVIKAANLNPYFEMINVQCDINNAASCNPTWLIYLNSIGPGELKITMNWDEKPNNLDINVFQVAKQPTLDSACLTESKSSNCSTIKITKTDDKGGLNGGEEAILDDSFKSDDYIYMIYVKDVSQNPEEFAKANIRITVADSEGSSKIVESTDNFDGYNFWFAGCLKATEDSFKFKEVNMFLKSPPYEMSPFVCNYIFGYTDKPEIIKLTINTTGPTPKTQIANLTINATELTTEPQMGKLKIDKIIDKVTGHELTEARVTISVLLDGTKHIIVNNGSAGVHPIEFIGTYTVEVDCVGYKKSTTNIKVKLPNQITSCSPLLCSWSKKIEMEQNEPRQTILIVRAMDFDTNINLQGASVTINLIGNNENKLIYKGLTVKGTAQTEIVTSGDYSIDVEKKGFHASHTTMSIKLQDKKESVEPLFMTLDTDLKQESVCENPIYLNLTVVDVNTGTKLPNATVEIVLAKTIAGRGDKKLSGIIPTDEKGQTGTDIEVMGTYQVVATKNEYDIKRAEVHFTQCKSEETILYLDPIVDKQKMFTSATEYATMTIKIFDQLTKQPVSSAKVAITYQNDDSVIKLTHPSLDTNDNGVLKFYLNQNGKYIFEVTGEKYFNKTYTENVTCEKDKCDQYKPQVLIYIDQENWPDKSLTITAEDKFDYQPIKGASVALYLTQSASGPSMVKIGQFKFTDENGVVKMKIPTFVNGKYTIRLKADGYKDKDITETFTCDMAECAEYSLKVDVKMKKEFCPDSNIRITVLNALTNKPMEGATVTPTMAGYSGPIGLPIETVGKSGSVRIDINNNGYYTIMVKKSGFISQSKTSKVDMQLDDCDKIIGHTIPLSPAMKYTNGVRLSLSWNENPTDMDLMSFTIKDNDIYGCLTYYCAVKEQCGCTEFDMDHRNGGLTGTETITYNCEEGTTHMIFVDDVSGKGISMMNSGAQITISDRSEGKSTSYELKPQQNMENPRYWIAGCLTLEKNGYNFQHLNEFSRVQPNIADSHKCQRIARQWAAANRKVETILTVTVRDGYQNKIGGANVLVANHNFQFFEGNRTNTNGQANIIVHENGLYSVSAIIDGYTTNKNNIQIKCNQKTACNKEVTVEVLKQSSVINSTIITLLSKDAKNNQPSLSCFKLNIENPETDNCRTADGACKGIVVDKSAQMVTLHNMEQQAYTSMIIVGCASDKCNDLNSTRAQIVVTTESKSETITMPSMDAQNEMLSQAEPDSRYWIAGCLKIIKKSFVFISSDTFTRDDPSKRNSEERRFCDKVFKKRYIKAKLDCDDAKIDMRIANSNNRESIKSAEATIYHIKDSNEKLIKENAPFKGDKISMDIEKNGIYLFAVKAANFNTMFETVNVDCDMNNCASCKPTQLISMIPIVPGKLKITMNWDEKPNDLDINVFQVGKQPTLEGTCLVDSKSSNCPIIRISETNDKGGLNGGEEVTFDGSFKSDDYVYMIYVKDASKNPEEFVKANIRITIADSVGSSKIVESTDNFDGDNFWFAGCLKANADSFKFKPVNLFMKSSPHEVTPFFCNDMFGLTIEPQTCFEPNTRYIGNNLNDGKKLFKDSDMSCRDACLQTDYCSGFVWEKESKKCWLKAGMETKKNEEGMVSGYAVCNLPKDLPGEWTEWSSCDKSCGGGFRTRKCLLKNTQIAATNCDNISHTIMECNTDPCPLIGEWTEWSPCDKTCSGGVRIRQCLVKNTKTEASNCDNISQTTLECNNPTPCPIDGGWSQWSICSKTCAVSNVPGVIVRSCNNPQPGPGGKWCEGPAEIVCATNRCPERMPNPAWTEWTDCDKTCGGGIQRRQCIPKGSSDQQPADNCPNINIADIEIYNNLVTYTRTCNNDPCQAAEKAHHGHKIPMSPLQNLMMKLKATRPVEIEPTKTDAGEKPRHINKIHMSQLELKKLLMKRLLPTSTTETDLPGEWTEWSSCDKSCGGGVRTRKCLLKNTQIEATNCDNISHTIMECNTDPCPLIGEWTEWSPCDKTCSRGVRIRQCLVKNTKIEATNCDNISQTTLECNNPTPCPIDGGWSQWSICSKTCAVYNVPGVIVRSCNNPQPGPGGKWCEGPAEITCATNRCPERMPNPAWTEWTDCDKTCGGGIQRRQCIQKGSSDQQPADNCPNINIADIEIYNNLVTYTRTCNNDPCHQLTETNRDQEICGWYKSCPGVKLDTCPQGSLNKCICVEKNKKSKNDAAKRKGVMVEGICNCSKFCRQKGRNCKAMLYCCGGEENNGKTFKDAATIGGSCN